MIGGIPDIRKFITEMKESRTVNENADPIQLNHAKTFLDGYMKSINDFIAKNSMSDMDIYASNLRGVQSSMAESQDDAVNLRDVKTLTNGIPTLISQQKDLFDSLQSLKSELETHLSTLKTIK